MRRIAEAYHISPIEVEEMTLDQIYLLVCDENRLRRVVSGTPQDLAMRGVIEIPDKSLGMSYVQRLRRQKQLEKERQERAEKRRRRAERRRQLLEFKRRQEGTDGDQVS